MFKLLKLSFSHFKESRQTESFHDPSKEFVHMSKDWARDRRRELVRQSEIMQGPNVG